MVYSFLLSSVRAGNGSLIISPSLPGVIPMFDFKIAFSIGPIFDLSQGFITSSLASGIEIVAAWLIGVSVP